MTGGGIVNSLIDVLPFEAHIPGYSFCGPGTKLEKRLARGDQGINPLDEACKEHDIAYSQHRDDSFRREADKILARKALARTLARDSSLSEKLAATLVTSIMRGKVAMSGGRLRKTKKRKQKVFGKGLRPSFRILPTPRIVKKRQRKVKRGGILPLLPILAGIGALGSLAGGAAKIAQAVNTGKSARKQLQELVQHNKKMEALASGKGLKKKKQKSLRGKGLYLYQKNR